MPPIANEPLRLAPLSRALALSARLLSTGEQWRPLVPEILQRVARAARASRAAWFEVPNPSAAPSTSRASEPPAWAAKLRSEWRDPSYTPGLSEHFEHQVRAQDMAVVPVDSSVAHASTWAREGVLLVPVQARGSVHGVLLAQQASTEREAASQDGQGNRNEEAWEAAWEELGALLAVALEHEALQGESEAARRAQREAERFHGEVLRAAGEGIMALDREGRLCGWNRFLEELSGFSEAEVRGWHASDVFPLAHEGGYDDYQRECEAEMACLLEQALRGQSGHTGEVAFSFERTGRKGWLTCTLEPRRGEGGEVEGVIGLVRDITAQREAQDELRKSERQFRSFIESTDDLICALAPDGTILYASPSMERAIGWYPIGPAGAPLWGFLHQDDRDRVQARVRHAVHQQPSQVLEEAAAAPSAPSAPEAQPEEGEHGDVWEMRLRHHDGTWRTFEVTCRNLLGDPAVGGLVLNARDVSNRKAVEAGLLRAALHDRLTGLPNRALFMDRLRRRVERSKRERYRPSSPLADGADEREAMFAVLFLDFDRFKVINDSLGHMVGDEMLKAVARRIEGCLRPGDTVARLGGDEFAILLDEITAPADAVQVAERIQKSLGKSFLLQREEERGPNGQPRFSTHEIFTSSSIGIALGGGEPAGVPYESAGDVLRDADMAMYRAKEKGRARHEIFSAHMHAAAMERLQMETDLRRSLEDGDFRVHYQPIIALESGVLSGFEALVRWHHPRRGMVAPGEFLDVAEETGLMAPLGWWVLRQACFQLRAWMDARAQSAEPQAPVQVLAAGLKGGAAPVQVLAAGGESELTMNVNLSARQFASDDLAERVCRVLEESGLRPRNLKLEITEATLITQSAVAARRLQSLHDIGVQLGLDDFGTGYSSIAYLHRFPIDSLKIDRSFISALGDERADAVHSTSIVSTILSLARQLNLNVVAEGVETPEQADRLRGMHCPMGQGFYFSAPMPHEGAALFLSSAVEA